MNEHFLIGLAAIVVLGILAQWISWKFRLPSILLLLLAGFFAGPLFGIVNPDELFGELLFPFVSFSVAVILFEGGLNLRLSEFRVIGGVVRSMITIGLLLTWIASSVSAYYILGLPIGPAVLFGAILVVTGPTVILPILRQVRLMGQVNSILKWEGILNDPIGAVLAVLVFESILATGLPEATVVAVTGLLKTVVFGGILGLLGGYFLLFFLKRQLIPDFLQNSISLMVVVAVYTGSNLIQAESGLFSTTIMGVFLANQKSIAIKNIIEFKENLRVMLISVLFIVLAARLGISDLKMLRFESVLFLLILILAIRPAAVFLSTIKSKLNWKEKLFLSAMAPRGIVAAAVSSLFALELVNAGFPQAERLVPLTFFVIIGTIAFSGLASMPLAKWLGLANPNPQGCLILGAHRFARRIAISLKNNGIEVLLVDTNKSNISAARSKNLNTYYGSIFKESIPDELNLNGIGRLLAFTSNEKVNSLATLYFSKIFGTRKVYQLPPENDNSSNGDEEVSQELRGVILFGEEITFSYLNDHFEKDCRLNETAVTKEFVEDVLKNEEARKKLIPLFLISQEKQLEVFTSLHHPRIKAGDVLVHLEFPDK